MVPEWFFTFFIIVMKVCCDFLVTDTQLYARVTVVVSCRNAKIPEEVVNAFLPPPMGIITITVNGMPVVLETDMKLLQLSLFLITCAIDCVMAANILVMLPLPLYSHTNNYMPIFKELAKRGHNVTMVSPFPQKTPIQNFHDIAVPDIFAKALFGDNGKRFNVVEMDGIIFDLTGLWWFGIPTMKAALACEPIQRLIKDTNSQFDLIIMETWFIQEPLIAFGHKFNAPVINVAAISVMGQSAHLTGNQLPLSYVPMRKLPYSDHMSFPQRLINSFYYYWDVIVGEIYYLKQQDAIMRQYFKYPGSENLPQLIDMLRNTSLSLTDSSFAIGYLAPLHKNVIEIGGINIKKNEKLPEDLQTFMDSATDGVVYFSFGSHLNVSTLKPEIQQVIIKTFGKLKLKVMMKLEDSNQFLNLTKPNTLVRSWFPQSSVLAHPNCKLFVTHGGIHGVMEAVYHAVPMVTIPLIADQKFNSKFVETVGIGASLKWSDLTEDNFLKAISTVLNNPIYKENINKRSAIFKDQPISTMDNVIYWIDYVIRHKGAPHLRPAVLDLHWYQYLMLDVIVFYLLILILFVFLLKMTLMLCYNFIKWLISCKQSSKKVQKKRE